eukprot:Hpha_TRINITY_DN17286_c0_g1::TRINITY_DN17286_c0_g1_i1::g.17769::m.17769
MGWGKWRAALWLLVGLGAQTCDAAGGVSIFLLGHTVDLRPWEVCAMYLLVFIVSVFYELLIHHIDHVVVSSSGKRIVESIYKEVMILGGISLILTVLENTAGEILFKPVYWHYVHFVVFFMMVNLIALVAVLFLFIERSWHRWGAFEEEVLGIENDPRLQIDEKHALLSHFFRNYGARKAEKMMACVLFYRSNLPECYRRVSFHKYMTKQQRKELLNFLDVHANAWICLAFLCIFVAIQTDVAGNIHSADGSMSADPLGSGSVSGVPDGSGSSGSSGNSSNGSSVPFRAAYPLGNTSGPTDNSTGSGSSANTTGSGVNAASGTGSTVGCGTVGSGSGSASEEVTMEFELLVMGLFVVLEGYGPVFVVWLCYRKILQSYSQFAQDVEAMRKERLEKPMSQKYYFWRGSPGLTMHILQVMLLYQVFYLATVTCNYAPRFLEFSGGWGLMIAAIIPPLLACTWLIPGLMPAYTILKSVGDLLDTKTLQHIQDQQSHSGVLRRHNRRDVKISAPAPALAREPGPFDHDVETLDNLDPANRRKMEVLAPERLMQQKLKYAFLHDPDPGESLNDLEELPPLHRPQTMRRIMCEECGKAVAIWRCSQCGVLCGGCDGDYHRLKRYASHHRVPVGTGGGAEAPSLGPSALGPAPPRRPSHPDPMRSPLLYPA